RLRVPLCRVAALRPDGHAALVRAALEARALLFEALGFGRIARERHDFDDRMVLGSEDQREVVDPLEAPDRTRQDDDPAEGPSEPLGLEHDDVAWRVLDHVVDVAPEDPPIPLDPLAPPSHAEAAPRLLADRVQDDLVDLVADLDHRTRVDPEVLADPSESLKHANPVVHVPETNRLRQEVSRDHDDVEQAEPRAVDAGAPR